jgi:hypothetical protein
LTTNNESKKKPWKEVVEAGIVTKGISGITSKQEYEKRKENDYEKICNK